MDLSLKNKFISLDPFDITMPNFVVLTGMNGAGKTQLLVGIQNKAIQILDDTTKTSLDQIKLVLSQGLVPKNDIEITRQQIASKKSGLWKLLNGFRKKLEINPRLEISSIGNLDHRKIIEIISRNAGKLPIDLTEPDIWTFYPLHDSVKEDQFFYSNFSNIFKHYHSRFEDNQINRYLNKEEGQTHVQFKTDAEFISLNGEPPWDFVNRILSEANLDYQVNNPTGMERDAPFSLRLINNLNGAEINFSDLSSGEKVIISLSLAVYNSNYDVEFPKVLLLDEPDASLHPSMSKQMLSVLENVFVKNKGVKVIITTHSPSTVALCNEDSLFVMNKTEPRIEKVSKDKALRILTAGVPSLSINYENRRQVFVESKHDAAIYDAIYGKLKEKLNSEVSLNFISSGSGGSGSNDQVSEIVSKLRGYGNPFIYGIVDWDGKNIGSDSVMVIAENYRHSIENLILDPILLAGFLLREKIIDRHSLSLEPTSTHVDFKNFDTVRLQSIADKIIDIVQPYITGDKSPDKTTIKYMNGKEIKVPSWFLQHHGHSLEDCTKEAFPQLKKYQKDNELKKAVVDLFMDDVRELIPYDFFDVFNKIQSHNLIITNSDRSGAENLTEPIQQSA